MAQTRRCPYLILGDTFKRNPIGLEPEPFMKVLPGQIRGIRVHRPRRLGDEDSRCDGAKIRSKMNRALVDDNGHVFWLYASDPKQIPIEHLAFARANRNEHILYLQTGDRANVSQHPIHHRPIKAAAAIRQMHHFELSFER